MWTSHPIGDRCWSFRCADTISAEASRRVLSAYRRFKAAELPGVQDVIPAYTEVALQFDPLQVREDVLRREVEAILRQEEIPTEACAQQPTLHQLPVVYDGEDLERVCAITGLPVEEVIRRHSASEYTVAMVGFLPHFPYCLGLDPALETPRHDSPRKRVPAGCVAMAGAQTGIYPQPSPGGWNLLGRTDPSLLQAICPGDRLTFTSVESLR